MDLPCSDVGQADIGGDPYSTCLCLCAVSMALGHLPCVLSITWFIFHTEVKLVYFSYGGKADLVYFSHGG